MADAEVLHLQSWRMGSAEPDWITINALDKECRELQSHGGAKISAVLNTETSLWVMPDPDECVLFEWAAGERRRQIMDCINQRSELWAFVTKNTTSRSSRASPGVSIMATLAANMQTLATGVHRK